MVLMALKMLMMVQTSQNEDCAPVLSCLPPCFLSPCRLLLIWPSRDLLAEITGTHQPGAATTICHKLILRG